jgi:hypothetical protein
MSNHTSLVCGLINFMSRLSSVLRKYFYSLFELIGPGGGGGEDGKSVCVNIVRF